MSNTKQLASAIEKHNARLDAHAANGLRVREMYLARANGKKKQVSKEEYEAAWSSYNAEDYQLKRLDLRPFRAMAAEAGVELQILKGWKLAIAEGAAA